MSTGYFFWGVKAAGAWDWRPTTLVVPNVKKSGALTYQKPRGPSRPVSGRDLTLQTLRNRAMPYLSLRFVEPYCTFREAIRKGMFFCFNMAPDILSENPRIVYYYQPYKFSTKPFCETLTIFVYLILMCRPRRRRRRTRTTIIIITATHTECIVSFAL
jgi:hypothetical protein